MIYTENNKVILSGEIISDFEYSHNTFGERFYITYISCKRNSMVCDIIPVLVSDRLIDINEFRIGEMIRMLGQFRSYNKQDENGKSKLLLFVFPTEFEHLECEENNLKYYNHISINCFICKPPNYRKTPLGREITDLLVAVNRSDKKSDYIPCITWGRNARFTGRLEIGEMISINGRIQSREYKKYVSEDKFEIFTTYEVSVSRLEVLDEARED